MSEKTSYVSKPLLTEKEIDQLLSALSSGEIDIGENGESNEDKNTLKQRVLTQREIDSLVAFYENAKKTAQNAHSINLDSTIKVKLTSIGQNIYYHKDDEFINYAEKMGMPGIQRAYAKIDTDGYTKFSLKNFMSIFGNYAHENIIEGNIIFISQ